MGVSTGVESMASRSVKDVVLPGVVSGDEGVAPATVTQKVESQRAIVLDVKFVHSMRGLTVATGQVYIA